MKQIYHNYKKWEDYKNGMYDKPINKEDEINNAIHVLSNCDLFEDICRKILKEWNIACDVNLSNVNNNRRAWLGQAACCYEYKVCDISTRQAWGRLIDKQRDDANKIADKIIYEYERKNRKVYQGVDQLLLF